MARVRVAPGPQDSRGWSGVRVWPVFAYALGVLIVVSIALRAGLRPRSPWVRWALVEALAVAPACLFLARELARQQLPLAAAFGHGLQRLHLRSVLAYSCLAVGLVAAAVLLGWLTQVVWWYLIGEALRGSVTLPPALETGEFLRRVVGAAVIAPLFEEFLFRGVMLHAWSARMGTRRAIVLSSLLFGALHFDFFLGASFLGLVLAVVRLRSGTLWIPVLLHSAINYLTLLQGVQMLPEDGELAQHPAWAIASLACLAGLLVYLGRSWPRLADEPRAAARPRRSASG